MRNLNQREANILSTLSANDSKIFSFDDAVKLLHTSRNATGKFLSVLVAKGWLRPIEKGKYLIIPLEAGPTREWSEEAFVIASHLIDPYAIAYWSALNYWSLTEQIPQTVFVSATRRRFNPEVEVLGISFKFIVLSEKKFFGFTHIWFGSKKVRITDKEKTIIDCLDHPEYCGGIIEAAKGLVNGVEADINLETMTAYARRLNNSTVFKRLGYLSEIFNLPTQGFASKWQEQIRTGHSLLDPTGSKTGRYNSKWNLRLNIIADELRSWRNH